MSPDFIGGMAASLGWLLPLLVILVIALSVLKRRQMERACCSSLVTGERHYAGRRRALSSAGDSRARSDDDCPYLIGATAAMSGYHSSHSDTPCGASDPSGNDGGCGGSD